MLRAMDSAVSGLRAHQNKLDVIGNNIANVIHLVLSPRVTALKRRCTRLPPPPQREARMPVV